MRPWLCMWNLCLPLSIEIIIISVDPCNSRAASKRAPTLPLSLNYCIAALFQMMFVHVTHKMWRPSILCGNGPNGTIAHPIRRFSSSIVFIQNPNYTRKAHFCIEQNMCPERSAISYIWLSVALQFGCRLCNFACTSILPSMCCELRLWLR